ncbi:hypothetical protein [Stutzerimonas nitrititolerans]|uniref:hypothetical protein n=1 Tax=Stutzerimonas nitrititolerans TaxID=2482751 RepID=UPI0035E3CBDD
MDQAFGDDELVEVTPKSIRLRKKRFSTRTSVSARARADSCCHKTGRLRVRLLFLP